METLSVCSAEPSDERRGAWTSCVDSTQSFVEGLGVSDVGVELCLFSQIELPFVLNLPES